ncbi:MAG: hypothetical protein ACR2QW_08720, partial [bacterium]
IPTANRSVYSKSALNDSVRRLPDQTSLNIGSDALPILKIPEPDSEPKACLLVSTGPGIQVYKEAINNLVHRHSWQVIECNDTGVVNQFENRITIILNGMRLGEIASNNKGRAQQIITGEKEFDGSVECDLFHYPYKIDDVSFEKGSLSIPDFEAGQYAISLAVAMNYRKIYLAGFVGYDEEPRNNIMEKYFNHLSEATDGVSLVSITPTRYRNLQCQSIYTL